MKLLSFARRDGQPSFGALLETGGQLEVLDLQTASSGRYATLRDLLDDASGLDFAQSAISRGNDGDRIDFEGLRLLPVITWPDKIFCVGVNYATHVKETGRETPSKPMIFTRFAATQIGAGEDLVLPHVSEKLDFEGELAVIIGRRSRYVPVEHALERVAGYSCYNDGSIRDWQRHSTQFTPGKNFPATGAFGPWMVTKDEMADLSQQTLTTRLNGLTVQSAILDDLIFGVPELVSYCSQFSTLEPGDIIVTGTTGGVGAFRDPPLWMRPGDTVEVEITGIGTLRNGVAAEPAGFTI